MSMNCRFFFVASVALVLWMASSSQGQDFRRGDANADGHVVGVVDSDNILRALFAFGTVQCQDAMDSNDDGALNIADPIHMLSGFFSGGAPIPSPGIDTCGTDPTPDSLGCGSYPNCVPGPIPPVDPDYELIASDASGTAGDTVTISVSLSNAVPAAGWSFGLCHTSGFLTLNGVADAPDLLTVAPAFNQTVQVGNGWYCGVLVDFLVNDTLPAGVHELYLANYTLMTDGVTSVDFCDTLATPTVHVAIVPGGGGWATPMTDASTVTISGSVAPVNDDCVDAITIGEGATTFVLVNATTDGPDLTGFCDFGAAGDEIAHQDVWYCFTPSADGEATFSTSGSGIDTRLAVYSGCTCPADPSTVLGCDDDALGFPPGESAVTLDVLAGQSYLIQVGTFDEFTATGVGSLQIDVDPMTPPANDDCANALLIGTGTFFFSLENATTDGPDLAGFCDPGPSGDDIVHQDVWFRYVAACTGDVTIDTSGSGLDTRLAVYAGWGCPADATNVITCDDDALGFPPGESSVSIPVMGGDQLLIQVGTFSETTGTGPAQLNIECVGISVPGEFRRGDANQDGTINIADPIYMLGFLFGGGPGSTCADSMDFNDDELLDVADPITGLSYLFVSQPIPAPGPNCGPDPMGASLDCVQYTACP
ncbi:MAG: hypothetical protein KDC38_07485 [Planctomycetes bacterium]|nr:hypothetical protein [Planctomycetota bacterium]